MNGKFEKGNIPWNKDTKGNGIMKPNKTSYKNGQTAGDKSNTWKGGIQKMRDCYYVYLGVGKRMVRAIYVWEKEYGEIPKGMVVFHIDGDKYNDAIENLELITRGELARRNRNV